MNLDMAVISLLTVSEICVVGRFAMLGYRDSPCLITILACRESAPYWECHGWWLPPFGPSLTSRPSESTNRWQELRRWLAQRSSGSVAYLFMDLSA